MADARAGVGVYAWLWDHDPSGLAVVGIDPATAHRFAPDARIRTASASARDCARALREHLLIAALARTNTPARRRLEDCGYALYRDDGSIVVAPR